MELYKVLIQNTFKYNLQYKRYTDFFLKYIIMMFKLSPIEKKSQSKFHLSKKIDLD